MSDPLLSVEKLEKHYAIREGLLNRQTGAIRAVDGIDFTVREGEVFGLLGESGCGKSTAARSLLRLEEPTAGTVHFDGEELTAYDAGELRAFRRRAQLVLQNPSDSFDPRMTIRQSVSEPLRLHGIGDGEVRASVVSDLLDRVGLSRDLGDRYPHELSGGQKQRAAIARALVLNPDLVVADEPVSALDVSIQAQVLELLSDLQREFGLSVLFITHDMNVIREVSDRVGVMYAGELVEVGPTEALFEDPQHPYTRALTEAVPSVGGGRTASGDDSNAGREGLSGEVPDPASPPSACRFHPRCPAVIPPRDLSIDQEVYRRLFDLYLAVENGSVDPDFILERAEGRSPGEELPADRDALRALIRDAYGVPTSSAVSSDETASDETVEAGAAALVDAAADVARGEGDPGVPAVAEPLESPCARERPETVSTGEYRRVACHLHDDVETVTEVARQ